MSGIPSPHSLDPRRSAKQLRKAALAGEAVALGRLRLVFDDLATAKAPTPDAISLRRCQHVIAVESGHASWKEMMAGATKPAPSRKMVVYDEFWDLMNGPQTQRVPEIRAMHGVPGETYRIRDDGRIYCAQALAHAVATSGEPLSQALIDRLLPDMWRPAAEAVAKWEVPTAPYKLIDRREHGYPIELVAENDAVVRILHDPFNAYLPGSYRPSEAYEILGQLVTGQYRADQAGPCSWRGITLEPVDNLDWRRLGEPPIALATGGASEVFADIQTENPLISVDGQRALAAHHLAWQRALEPYAHRALRLHETDGQSLNNLPWHRVLRDPDNAYDDDAAEVRESVPGYLPPAIPNHILASYQQAVSHGQTDRDTVIWQIIGEQLIGYPIGMHDEEILTRAARYAVARWNDGMTWDAAAVEARRVGVYDHGLVAIVDRVRRSNAYIAGKHPQPPRIGPAWRTMAEHMADMIRLGRHQRGGGTFTLTQYASDFDRALGASSR